MTIGKLVLVIGLIALVLTALTVFVFKKHKSRILTFLQHFTGALFIVSGFVKAVDPLGTAYKTEQYFAEFEIAFEPTFFSFLSPLFPWLSSMSAGFSVGMIVLEIVLGVLLLLGVRSKFTSWAFLLLLLFFTVLTGFTYLTGYVPSDANFFEFGKWGGFKESNMKVTDCGCFGDFIKLKPKVSFIKDLVLLVPAFIFIFRFKDFHTLLNKKIGDIVAGLILVTTLIYCLSNYAWDLPGIDFRPFKEGVNIAKQKALEEKAEASVDIVGWIFKNSETNQFVEVMEADYTKAAANYPKDKGWTVEDQIKTEPSIPRSKISDFEVSDADGNDITSDLLSNEGYSFMVVSYKLYSKGSTTSTVTRYDSVFVTDTVMVAPDSMDLKKRLKEVIPIEETSVNVIWDPSYVRRYELLNPVLEAAEKNGIQSFALTSYADPAELDDFRHETQSAYPFHMADDILLKTIVRSNPGLVLLKNGEIIRKWHYRNLPSFEELKRDYSFD